MFAKPSDGKDSVFSQFVCDADKATCVMATIQSNTGLVTAMSHEKGPALVLFQFRQKP